VWDALRKRKNFKHSKGCHEEESRAANTLNKITGGGGQKGKRTGGRGLYPIGSGMYVSKDPQTRRVEKGKYENVFHKGTEETA